MIKSYFWRWKLRNWHASFKLWSFLKSLNFQMHFTKNRKLQSWNLVEVRSRSMIGFSRVKINFSSHSIYKLSIGHYRNKTLKLNKYFLSFCARKSALLLHAQENAQSADIDNSCSQVILTHMRKGCRSNSLRN